MTSIRESNEQLQRNMHQFMRTIRALSNEQFLLPLNGWSPRDIVAHLIGWNRAGVDMAVALCKGETPAVLLDPGEDFSKVNAAFCSEYNSTDAIELLRELELSYQELARHLFTVDAEDWTREVALADGVDRVSIEQCIQDISGDYDVHRQEIEQWLKVTPIT